MPTLEDSLFVESLRRSDLLPDERMAEILRRANPAVAPETFAQALVERNFITPFQADELLRGNHRRLKVAGFIIQEPLGWGGMGTVFRAVKHATGQVVALKVLSDRYRQDAAMRARFRLEAKAGQQFKHPNLIATYDSGTTEEVFGETDFVSLELFEGINLQELVTIAGKLPYGAACDMITQAARGIQEIHALGMVHRDIKPDNILIDRDGQVKVVDFGLTLANQVSFDEEFSLSMIFGQECLGTLDYMAPEQAVDSLHVDARADIYSLGCTLFAILAARRPYTEKTAATILDAHKTHPVPVLAQLVPGIPKGLSDLVVRMMAKSATERPVTMLAVVQALATYAKRKPIPFHFAAVVQGRREKAQLRGIQTSLAGSMPTRRSSAARLSTIVNNGPTTVPLPRVDRKLTSPPASKDGSPAISVPPQRPPRGSSVPEEQRLLLVFDGGDTLLIHHAETLIGRSQDCAVQFDDPELALHHSRLQFDGQRWILTSVGGVHLMVNRESRKTTLLKIGDHIQLSAKTQFKVRRPPPTHRSPWVWVLLGILGLGIAVAVGWLLWP
jgi:eukaryotic-like serine/threonine-protein kinase